MSKAASPKTNIAPVQPDHGSKASPERGHRLPPFDLRHADQAFVVGACSLALLILVCQWFRAGSAAKPIPVVRGEPFRLDVNSATPVEWMQLEGIGRVLANRIVADREQNGTFSRISELARVRGIGPKTVARLRPALRIGADSLGQAPRALVRRGD